MDPTQDSANAQVSFSVNVCNADVPFLDPTIRHMIRQLDYRFCERVLTYDPGRQEGKYSERRQGTREQMEHILDGLLRDGVIDRVDVVPWDSGEQERILGRYFCGGDVDDLKDFSGAPIYQYLYALDRCRGDYIFHADSDMLFHRGDSRSWIDIGLALLRERPDAVVCTPQGGPPQAANRFEKLIGRPLLRREPLQGWHVATFTSTRYFLMDVARFHSALPLQQAKPREPLENSLSHTFNGKGLRRYSMNGYMHYAVHPWKHDDNHIRYLHDLIWAVENDVYPFVRSGFPWDMRTDGELIHEWLGALRKAGRPV
ncbi:glycosyltransferase family A protein [Methyloversatilis discipulorum]|jgi:hypothetical protein|uniref:glycosyltransferase family A protein n=1 Tax=Methyloversatilis discipulorum TaxID=1119528 RepID=UPI003F304EE0